MSGTTKLVAGHINPVSHKLTTGSMAAAIYDQLELLLPLGETEDPRYRQSLAIAIAVGVIKHLHDNANAIDVDVGNVPGYPIARNPTITVDLA